MRRIMQTISKLLNLRPAEWPRFLVLYGTMFLTNIGFIWGRTIVETETLLQRGGLAALPWVLIGSAVGLLGVSAIYAAFADRIANDWLLIAIYLIGALAGGVGLLLLGAGMALVAFPLLYLVMLIAIDSFNLHWATYVNGFYDTQASKRIFPLLSSAARIASIVAGVTLTGLTLVLPGWAIVALALGALGLAALLAWGMPALLGEARPMTAQAPAPASALASLGAYIENVREGYRFVAGSSFLRWMAASALLLMMALTLLTYQTSVILAAEFASRFGDAARQEMAAFLGWVNAVTNLLMLPFLFFLLSRIITRIGLGNANLIFPLGNLAISGGLIAAPGIASAGLAYFDRTTFRLTFQWTLDGLLYNAVPLRVKGRARAFIGGLVVPLGMIAGGALLLVSQALPASWGGTFIPALIGASSIAYLGTAIAIRRQYARALIKLLEQEDYSALFLQGDSDLAAADPATLAMLRKRIEASTSPELTIFMATLIGQVGGGEAAMILGQTAHGASDPRVRAAILNVLAGAGAGATVRQTFVDFLADADGGVRQAAIAGLESLAGPADRQFLDLAFSMLEDPEIEVRAHVLPPLLRAPEQSYREAARRALSPLVESPDPAWRAAAVRVLAETADAASTRLLTRFMRDADDGVRLEAALAAEQLAAQGRIIDLLAPLTVERAIELAGDPVERTRQAALAIIGRLGSHAAYPALVRALADASPAVRETAAGMLVALGRAAVPLVHPLLESGDQQVRKMATVILSRVSRREFGPLIDSLITGNLLAIYRNLGRLEALAPCERLGGVAVMRSALREQNERLIDEAFYLLSATSSPATVRLVAESLQSEDARVRANAAEALEGLTTPQTAQLIVPLLDPTVPPGRLLRLSRETWDMQHPDLAQTFRQLLGDQSDPFARAIMTFALGELAADGAPPPAPPPEPTAPRRRPADLLGALMGDAAAPPAPARGNGLLPFSLAEAEALLARGLDDQAEEVRAAARAAQRMIRGAAVADERRGAEGAEEGEPMLSTIEKIIFLKEVPFFQAMSIDQLKVLANVCEEELFPRDSRIFGEGDPGGALYVVVSGRVGIEHEKRKGSIVRLATMEANSYFGEMNLFDNSPRSASAVALQDTLTLRLRREPLIALARQHPDLSLKLIDVLSQRLRETNDRVADLTRSRPRELHKLFDQFE